MKKLGSLLAAAVLVFGVCSTAAYGLTPNLNIGSDSYIVIEADTGQVLAEKNSSKQKYPASITKILTAGIALSAENCKLDDRITLKKATVNEIVKWGNSTTIALEAGENISLRDALYAMMIVSANDAADAVAQYVTPNIADFPALMNAQVQALGLTGTHFTNAHGLPDSDHYTTAYDMAMMTKWALTVPGFEEVLCCTEYDMPDSNKKSYGVFGTYHHMLVNSAYYYEGAIGGKLGWTSDAHHTAVTLAERDGVRLICVVLDTTDKWQKYKDTAVLFDYCFDHYKKLTLPMSSISGFDVPLVDHISGESLGTVQIAACGDLTLLVQDDISLTGLKVDYGLPDSYYDSDTIAPVCTISAPDGSVLLSIPLEYDTTISKPAKVYTSTGSSHSALMQSVFSVVKTMGILAAACAGLLLLARLCIQTYYKRRRRRAHLRYRDYPTRQ